MIPDWTTEMKIAVLISGLIFLGLPVNAEERFKKIRGNTNNLLSCDRGRKIKIIRVTETFGSQTSYCDDDYCYWYEGYIDKSPPCEINETVMTNISSQCDGKSFCDLNVRISYKQKCCYKFWRREECRNNTGYEVHHDCVTGRTSKPLPTRRSPYTTKTRTSRRTTTRPSRRTTTRTSGRRTTRPSRRTTTRTSRRTTTRTSIATTTLSSSLTTSRSSSGTISRSSRRTTGATTRTIPSTLVTSTIVSLSGVDTSQGTANMDRETGGNTVIVVGAVVGAAVFVTTLVIVFFILKKRRYKTRRNDPDEKNNASVVYRNDSAHIVTHNPHITLDDGGYNHLPDSKTDNSNFNQGPDEYNHVGNAGASDDNYHHFGAGANSKVDDSTYNHAVEDISFQPHVQDDYNHIRGHNFNINFTADDYNHIKGDNTIDDRVKNFGSFDNYNHIGVDKNTKGRDGFKKIDNFDLSYNVAKKCQEPEVLRDVTNDYQTPEGVTNTQEFRRDKGSERIEDSDDIYVNQEHATDLSCDDEHTETSTGYFRDGTSGGGDRTSGVAYFNAGVLNTDKNAQQVGNNDDEYANLETNSGYVLDRTSGGGDRTSGVVNTDTNDHQSCNNGTTEYTLAGPVQNIYENY